MGALPSYTGAGKSTLYANQAALRKAALGTKKIQSFFKPQSTSPHIQSPAPQNQLRSSESPEIELLTSDARSSSVNTSNSPSYPDSAGPASASCDIPEEFGTEAGCITERASTSTEHVTQSPASVHTEQLQLAAPTEHVQQQPEGEAINPIQFLDLTADDEDQPEHVPVAVTVKDLLAEAKKHKSFTATFKLQAVKTYLELLERYRRIPNVKNPLTRASLAVAKSIGKGPYFARSVRRLVVYIGRFNSLPPTGSGKHHAHPSLLNNERIYQAVRRYLTVQPIGEVC